jgi:exopolysaccharide biosynthesis predicted pyruvyltransferase EpsI
MVDADARYLKELRDASLRELAEAIGPSVDVALLDIPNQINVGDSLIWAGEMEYLDALGLRLKYASDLHGYEPGSLRRAMPEGVVLIHGGGNFGDLWLGHQQHREQISKDLPDYRIVQLPQSVYFQSESRAAEANRVLREHPDFRLLARDAPSVSRAASDLPDVRVSFCHDMALGWDAPAWDPPETSSPRILVIARDDRESSSGLASLTPDWLPNAVVDVTDWGDLGGEREKWQRARQRASIQHHHSRLARHVAPLRWPGFQPGIQRSLAQINRSNITAGVALYDTASGAVVDRLHAHIIAALRGVPHILLDNSYGKLKAVYEDYTHGFSTAHYVTTLSDAREAALRFGG